MKNFISFMIAVTLCFTACAQQKSEEGIVEITGIELTDNGVYVGGKPASTDSESAVYVSDDIVFYLENQGENYGEGTADESHSQDEADKHTVVNITQPGHYNITGKISHGQIAVNLGEMKKTDSDAMVNIILNNADITCTVAPAIICYNAFECGDGNVATAVKDVDTVNAGFNIVLADGSVNNINGGHVAKIYKEGTTDKLHKYDAAIESLVSMNIYGEDGVLNLTSDNEGIETKMHMTVNGGIININSADDALNAGEDGVSVITINNGQIMANSNNGNEGDGIDSNGWVVINGGCVSAFGNSKSMDSGLDSDNGVYINGGTVFATGNMYDEIVAGDNQNFMALNFIKSPEKGEYVLLENQEGILTALEGMAGGTVWIYSSPQLTSGDYKLYRTSKIQGSGLNGVYTDIAVTADKIQLSYTTQAGAGGMYGMPGGEKDGRPQEIIPQGDKEKAENPPHFDFSKIPRNDMPGDIRREEFLPEKFQSDRPQQMPEFQKEMPDMGMKPQYDNQPKIIFTVQKGANSFGGITEYTQT